MWKWHVEPRKLEPSKGVRKRKGTPPPSVHIKFFKEKDQSGPATPFYRVEAEKEIKIFGVIFGYNNYGSKCRHNFSFNMVLEALRNFNLVSLFTFIQGFHLNFVVILTNSIVFLQIVKCFDGNFNWRFMSIQLKQISFRTQSREGS